MWRHEYEGEIKVWDAATGKLRETLGHTHHQSIRYVTFASDGQGLFALGVGQEQAELITWDLGATRLGATQPRIVWPIPVGLAVFAPNRRVFAARGLDVQLWDVVSGKPLAHLPSGDHPTKVLRFAFTPDSRTLAGGALNGPVYIWDVASHARRAILYHTDEPRFLNCLAFAPDGQTLAVGQFALEKAPSETPSRARIVLWNMATLKQRGILEVPAPKIGSLAFSPDGQRLAGSAPGGILLWDVRGLPAGK